MKNLKKLMVATALVGAFGLYSMTASATDIDVEGTLDAQLAVSLTKNTDMDFGEVTFDTTHSGTIQLGSNGTPALNGASGLTLDTTGATAGDITVNSTSGTVEISCETGGTLSDGTNTLTISSVGFDIDTGAAFGSIGNSCAGLGTTPVTEDTAANNNPQILLGAAVTIGANALNAGGATTYNTTNAGGDPVTVRVVYQ